MKSWLKGLEETRVTSFLLFIVLISLFSFIFFKSNFDLIKHPSLQEFLFGLTNTSNIDDFIHTLSFVIVGDFGLIFLYLIQVINRVLWHIHKPKTKDLNLKSLVNLPNVLVSIKWCAERLIFTIAIFANILIVSYLIIIFNVNYTGALWVGLTYHTTLRAALTLLGDKK